MTHTPLAFQPLDAIVDAFESALGRDPFVDLATFLPSVDHPDYLTALCELVRVDLECSYVRGTPRSVAEYRQRFPAAFAVEGVLAGVVFEEYRQRRLRGEAVDRAEYGAAYGIDVSGWAEVEAVWSSGSPLHRTAVADAIEPFRFPDGSLWPSSGPMPSWDLSLDVSEGDSLEAWLSGVATALPEPGSEFEGFWLEEELGRGAFGRVYLARQGALSGRAVAVKVAYDIFGESQTLAQLQHTNIVPIYSYHRSGRLQAVCMPYFGRTTLAQVVMQISGLPGLPSSGKELHSTVNRRKSATAVNSDTARPEVTAAGPLPEPGPAPDGWARLDGLSYVEAVLWLVAQLADGLAHAHARGIVHRDLKPANVLLTDEGRPMLLDFNLAEDTKLRGTAEAARVGGTLPYMAPEQLDAFRKAAGVIDGRCDLFALGVILFELLACRHPYPVRVGPARDVVPAMIADRQRVPTARGFNPAVSPATDAIVQKCLSPDPAERYQTAEALREDLERQLASRTLRYAPDRSAWEWVAKWSRRHPRLSSSAGVGVAAAVLLAAVGGGAAYAVERSRDDRARVVFADHRHAFADVQVFLDDRNQSRPRLDEALAKCRGVLARYGVAENGTTESWLAATEVKHLSPGDRDRLLGEVGETFYLMAQVAYLQARSAEDHDGRRERAAQALEWNTTAARLAGERLPLAFARQQFVLAHLDSPTSEIHPVKGAAGSARDEVLHGVSLAQAGRLRDAVTQLTAATTRDPVSLSGWFVRGTTHLDLGQPDLAAACFTACIALRQDFAPAWLNRGHSYSRMRFYPLARADYDRALVLDASLTEAGVQRAFVRDALGDAAGAEADFTQAIATGNATPRVHFLRASVRTRLKMPVEAGADVAAGFSGPCRDELSWVARSEKRLATADAHAGVGGAAAILAAKERSLADVDEALAINPVSAFGLQQKAHVLSEQLGRQAEAMLVLNRLVRLQPDSAAAVAGRGVLHARAGDRAAALKDAEAALLLDTKAPNLYQVACIYALTMRQNPEDSREARRLLWAALKTGYGLDLVDSDTDLDALRDDPQFRSLLERARKVRAELTR